MQYIYGPVQSRRLGLSLGVSLIPHKTCNFDCVYCQLGKTRETVAQRREYIKITDVIQELAGWLQQNPEQAGALNYITLSGAGEPTLNTAIGECIAWVKKNTAVSLCVMTNGSTLIDPAVRQELLAADLVVPSLDAAVESVFQAVDRPISGLKVEEVIGGIELFRREYRGKIWLEIMLIKGKNEGIENIRALVDAAGRIRPDKIQLNSPVRCTTEPDALPLEEKRLLKIKEMFGDRAEII
jgi:wyosine [tRNA(Phe)-imidazoG37] synthetase (radical SAM superfamily)